MTRYWLAWFPMVAIAIINGAMREKTYGRVVPELRAHQISTVLALALLGSYIASLVWLWPPASDREAAIIGAGWVAATIGFEFGFGHFIAGHSWSRLLRDYDVRAGRVWIAVPVFIGIAPLVLGRVFSRCI